MTENLFTRIDAIQPKLPGWCVLPKAHALAAAVLTLRPDVVVEIGVFGGSSFVPMAMALKEIGRGTAIGIDPWNNAAAAKGMQGEHEKWWGTTDLEGIYNGFTDKITSLGLNDCVKIFRMESDAVSPPPEISILHIDGNHSDQAIKDVERFASKVRIGGLCFSDDIQWEGGGVLRSVEKLKMLGFRQIYDIDKGAMFQRIK